MTRAGSWRAWSAGVTVLVVGLGGLVAAPVEASVAHSRVASEDPVSTTPHVLDGAVKALLKIGGTVYVGGRFGEVQAASGGPKLKRRNLMAFDESTGAVLPWAPNPDNEVWTLVEAPDRTVVAGGFFKTVNGRAAKSLVKLDPVSGDVVAGFAPALNGGVRDAARWGDAIVIGGRFTKVGSATRQRLAAVDGRSGAVLPALDLPVTGGRVNPDGFTEPEHVWALDVSNDGRWLVILGNFTTVAGQTRHQVALIDLGGARPSVANWATSGYERVCNTDFLAYVRDVSIAPDGDWFVVVTTGGNRWSGLCDSAARFETGARGTDVQPTWVDSTGGDTLLSTAVTGEVVYVGGHQRWFNNPYLRNLEGPGFIAREGIAALDPLTGLPLPWNPGRSRGVGAWELLATPDRVYVGSDTIRLGGEYHGRLGGFPVTGLSVTRPRTGTLPGTLDVITMSGTVQERSFDGTTVSPMTATGTGFENTRGAFMISGRLYTGTAAGGLSRRTKTATGFSAPVPIDLRGLDTAGKFSTEKVSGMFYDRGRLYYTVSGQNKLFWRWFLYDGEIVGAVTFTAVTGGSVPWATLSGMTMADGKLFYAKADGSLFRVPFADGHPTATPTQVAGSGFAGRGMFVVAP